MTINLEEYAGTSEFPVVDAGDYEVVLTLQRKETKPNEKGEIKEFVNLQFRIRDDVDQKFKGSCIFDKAWQDKGNSEWFDLKKLGSILATQKGKEGYRTSFDEVDEFIQYINGAHLIITVEKNYDDYSGKEVNSVKYLSYKPSKWDLEDHPVAAKPTVQKNDAAVDLDLSIAEDKLPF